MSLRRALATALIGSALFLMAACGDKEPTNESGPDKTASAPADAPAAAAKNFADCSAIPAADMAPALGEGTATSEVPPASTSCTYQLDDPRLPSVNIEQFTTDDFAEGWDGAKAKIGSTQVGPMNGTPAAAPGIGDDAITVTDTTTDGVLPNAIGLVKIGDTIVRANVLDASGKTPEEITEVTKKILQVIVDHS